MAKRVYRVKWHDQGYSNRNLSLDGAMKKARAEMQGKRGPFQVSNQSADGWGPEFPALPAALAALKDRAKAVGIGDDAVIKGARQGTDFHVRAMEVQTSPPAPSNANAKIQRIWREVHENFKNVGSMGTCVRRPIAGSASWSQHSPWPHYDCTANAWDIAADAKTMNRIRTYLEKNAHRLDVGYVIHDRMVSFEGQNRHAYTGVDPHTSHVHVDCSPEQTGSPCGACRG